MNLYSSVFLYCRPDGYLYDKESILEYVIAKKKEIAKQQKTYDKQLKTEQVI